MQWLLEPDLFREGPHPLTAAVTAAGQDAIRWDDDWWSAPDRMPPPTTDPVIFHGGLGNASHRDLDRWSPQPQDGAPPLFGHDHRVYVRVEPDGRSRAAVDLGEPLLTAAVPISGTAMLVATGSTLVEARHGPRR